VRHEDSQRYTESRACGEAAHPFIPPLGAADGGWRRHEETACVTRTPRGTQRVVRAVTPLVLLTAWRRRRGAGAERAAGGHLRGEGVRGHGAAAGHAAEGARPALGRNTRHPPRPPGGALPSLHSGLAREVETPFPSTTPNATS
jgi:hypothetical protein